MAQDKKISALISYAPVVDTVVIPASFIVENGKYTTGKIEALSIKDYVLKETDTKVATSEDLLKFATENTVGKQIYLTTADANYGVGLYVVTGAGTVQKLAATTASGDFASDIADLQAKDTEIIASYTAAVADLQAKDAEIIASYTAAVADLQAKDAEIITSYTAADSALDARIKAIEDAPYATVSAVSTAKSEAISSANGYTDTKIAAIDFTPYAKQADLVQLQGSVTTNTQAIATLNGDATVEGSVAKQVTDEIAKVVAYAPTDFDTLKEIADYIANDQTGAAELANRISALENAGYATVSQVETAKGEAVSSANGYTDEQITAVNTTITENEKVTAASLTDLNSRVSTLEGFDHSVYALKSEVESVNSTLSGRINTLSGAIDTLDATFATKEEVQDVVTGYTGADSALSGRIDALEAIQHDTFATKTEVQDVVTGYTGADAAINETISQLQATITALETKLAKYDERFGYQEDGDWTVNFLVID